MAIRADAAAEAEARALAFAGETAGCWRSHDVCARLRSSRTSDLLTGRTESDPERTRELRVEEEEGEDDPRCGRGGFGVSSVAGGW